jgi:hypothetical protein
MTDRIERYRLEIRGDQKGLLKIGRGVDTALQEMNAILKNEVDILKEANAELT